MTLDEAERAFHNDEMYVITSPFNDYVEYKEFTKAENREYSSINAPQLMLEDIERLIAEYNLGF
ncbi:hypothetical protein D3C81_2106590 [compost metagenome]